MNLFSSEDIPRNVFVRSEREEIHSKMSTKQQIV
jgi:hypothetical protein